MVTPLLTFILFDCDCIIKPTARLKFYNVFPPLIFAPRISLANFRLLVLELCKESEIKLKNEVEVKMWN